MNNNNNAEYVPLLCKSRYVSPFVLKRENKRMIEVVENKNAQVTPHVYERGNHPPPLCLFSFLSSSSSSLKLNNKTGQTKYEPVPSERQLIFPLYYLYADLNLFTAPAYKIFGLKNARTPLKTVYFPALWHINLQCYAF